jgi:hypothetical protein
MASPPVSIGGAINPTTGVHALRHQKSAAGLVSSQINQSAISTSAAAGADTVHAGTPSLLISMGGVDTLGSGSGVLQLLGHHHGAHAASASTTPDTPAATPEITFAASGNLTLLGGGFTEMTPAPTPPAGSAGMIPTVFGAATGSGGMAVDLTPGGSMQEHIASVAGGAPDLLLGWSFPQSGVTLDFAPQAGHGGGAKLRDGTEIQIGNLPKNGVIDVIFNKSS